jgi:hypothetical protein
MMRRANRVAWTGTLLLLVCGGAAAQGRFEIVGGRPFDSAFVKDFYLEGNSIPTERRNAALIKTPTGARVEFALLDTSGYSSQIQQKYSGMIISEGEISVGGVRLSVGSFGFGLKMPHPPDKADAQVSFYDQAGKKIGQCTATRESAIKAPRPLQITMSGGGARLYLGVYWVELQ